MGLIKQPVAEQRDFEAERVDADLVVVGGGLAGTCCAITAARAGIRVGLLQDRPVLGGNASSEVRLWTLGATAHMGNNNRWAREGGAIDEILVENLYRNPEGNAVILDTILLEKVRAEKNITLLLNTAALEVSKSAADRIASVRAFNSQNSTMYELHAPLFCDASGDGVVGFLSGAAFRMGAETRDEFGEAFAPDEAYGHLLGHTIYFFTKDAGRPVRFVPPAYALDDITKIPRYGQFNAHRQGAHLWWIEYGGRLDTVHDTECIKWELWKVVYGVWHHIKNSGQFPEADTLTLEWVGLIPGKRESRRFEGAYMLRQQDIIEQREHDDVVAHGGWSIDLHPADGVYSARPGCDQWHAKGVYGVPYRCLYSRDIANLFLAGRIFSASHVAFGSTRVMATLAACGQAVGMAAALCTRDRLRPGDLSASPRIEQLQRELMRAGQFIPGRRLDDPDDLARQATITASSSQQLAELPADGPPLRLEKSWAQLLPAKAGPMPKVSFVFDVAAATTVQVELRTSSKLSNFTPDVTLASKRVDVKPGDGQRISVDFKVEIDQSRYVFACLMANEHVAVRTSERRVTGLASVVHRRDQEPPDDIGVETFEFWTPMRRPDGRNLAVQIDPPIELFGPEQATNGIARPTNAPNAWVADPNDEAPTLTLRWPAPQKIRRVELGFDTDFEHPLESVFWNHPENVVPFCVRHYRIRDASGRCVAECTDNHQTRNTIVLDPPVETERLTIELLATHGGAPPSLFDVRCYAEA